MAQWHKRVTVSATDCGFDSLIFSIIQCAALFYHSTHNACRIWRKVGSWSALMRAQCFNTRFPGWNSEAITYIEANRGATRSVTVKNDWLWVRFPLEEMKYLYFHFFALVSRQSAALSSATQHAMPPEFGRKWGTECLNTRFPSAYPAVCGIQREADFYNIYIFSLTRQ